MNAPADAVSLRATRTGAGGWVHTVSKDYVDREDMASVVFNLLRDYREVTVTRL